MRNALCKPKAGAAAAWEEVFHKCMPPTFRLGCEIGMGWPRVVPTVPLKKRQTYRFYSDSCHSCRCGTIDEAYKKKKLDLPQFCGVVFFC